MELLDVTGLPYNDTSIEDSQLHVYLPYTSGDINYNDEIRIAIQDLEALTAPCNSFLHIEGQLTQENGSEATNVEFINNAIAYLFKEIRYELNGTVVDSVRDVGLVSTLKGYASYNQGESNLLEMAGWFPRKNMSVKKDKETQKEAIKREGIITNSAGHFDVIIPVKHLMGFFEDFQRLMVYMRQELVLIRSSSDNDAVVSPVETEKPKVKISRISWNVPHVTLSLAEQLKLGRIVSKGPDLPIHFRSWEIIELPSLSTSTRHTWPVKTSTKVETPRHILIAFQKNKKNKVTSDMSKFDDISLRDIRVFLNSDRYPYSNLLLDFENNKFASLYNLFSKFQNSFYGKENQPIFNPKEFKDYAPIAHIDCSYQREVTQTGSVVLRIEFETNEATTNDISAYCLILHEKRFVYNPLNKTVRQY